MVIQNYLFFDGRCEEAIEFYRKALGAQVQFLMRFRESPDQSMVKPETANKIMHATLKVGDTPLMMSDGDCHGKASFAGFSLAISVKDEAEARKLFDAVSDGGQVSMPLSKTFFSPAYGMASDRFGVHWMVMAEGAQTSAK
jgi:PhnB protein